jgi:hypothetical protein
MRSAAEESSKGGEGESTYAPNRKDHIVNSVCSQFIQCYGQSVPGKDITFVQRGDELEYRTGIQEIRGGASWEA